MVRRVLTYSLALAAWLILGCSLHVHAQTTAQPTTWSSTSSYRMNNQSFSSYQQPQPSSRSYTPACRSISAYDPNFGQGANLSTYFQSTTADDLLSPSSPHGNSRRSGWGWSDPSDDDLPTGVVANPTPVGEPLILLAIALLYIVCLNVRYQRRKATKQQI